MTSTERRRLEAQYREPIDARAELAKCAAGLLVIVAIAASSFADEEQDSLKAAVSAPRVASGR
jgi:hypothetical protein